MSITATQNVNDITVTATQSGVSVDLQPTIVVGGSGGGYMLTTTYDPAGKSEQLVGISDTSYVTEAKLATQYKGSSVISALDVDWSASQVYTKTLTGNTVLTFSNLYIGVKSLIITGNFTIGFPTGFSLTTDSNAYDGTKTCLISIECWDTSTPLGLVHITYAA